MKKVILSIALTGALFTVASAQDHRAFSSQQGLPEYRQHKQLRNSRLKKYNLQPQPPGTASSKYPAQPTAGAASENNTM